jgi:hypothetical protein
VKTAAPPAAASLTREPVGRVQNGNPKQTNAAAKVVGTPWNVKETPCSRCGT